MTRTVLAALVLFALAAWSGREIGLRREAAGLPATVRAPLGGFEPLAVDVLWMRGNRLLSERRLFEAAAVFRLVAEIEPHVTEAYVFPAWVLAWTGARSAHPEAEWPWVAQAIELIDKGLAVNPRDVQLLFTLAQIHYRRLALEESIYGIAREKLGRRPEEAAIEVLDRLEVLDPKLAEALLADTWRRLGERRLAEGDEAGARVAFLEALPRWRKLAAGPDPGGAPARVAEIESRLR